VPLAFRTARARTIASGKAVKEVTREFVAELNAKHARDQAGVTKAAALELLRRNRQEAAAAVRAIAADELDRAAIRWLGEWRYYVSYGDFGSAVGL